MFRRARTRRGSGCFFRLIVTWRDWAAKLAPKRKGSSRKFCVCEARASAISGGVMTGTTPRFAAHDSGLLAPTLWQLFSARRLFWILTRLLAIWRRVPLRFLPGTSLLDALI